jgi:hypothetical protein
MIIALVAGSIDPCHPVLSFPRKNNTRRDDVGCLSDTPDRSVDRSIDFRSVPVAFEFTVDPSRSPFERVDFAIDF